MFEKILTTPQIFGLILDILGAFYLAKSFIFKRRRDIEAEAYGDDIEGKYPGGFSDNLRVSFFRQRDEAIIGFLFLLLGFILQGAGVLFLDFIIPVSARELFVYLIIILVVVECIRRKRATLHAIAKRFKPFDTPPNENS